jgi:hypothetical protein
MTEYQEPFVASLWRDGNIEPYESKALDAEDWDSATRLAKEWATANIAASGGLTRLTWLHLKRGAEGRFIDRWSHP